MPKNILHNQRRPSGGPHLVIVGGGISGLSAAFYARRAARAAGMPLRCTLIERDARFGGKLLTETIADPAAAGEFVVEAGPDSFLLQKPWGAQLARDLGLEDQLIGTNEARRKIYVLIKGRPRPMPDGLMLVVPTRLMPFALSPVISLRGKLRMALDWFIPARRDGVDETLAGFIRRRLGAEALDKIAEPLMAGIHSAEAERQSLLATFPRLREVEAQHGSLIRGMIAQRTKNHPEGTRPRTENQARSAPRQAREPQSRREPRAKESKAAASPFVTLRGGIGTLVEALVRELEDDLICGRGVAAIDYDQDAPQPYRVRLDDGATLDADAVILTAPAYTAADLVAPFQSDLAAQLRQIRYVTTGTVALAYRRAEIGNPLDGYGLIIPHSERRRINACTISSDKFAHRAPDDHVLLRVFFGGSRNPDVPALDDEALLALVRAELRDILHIEADPLFSRIYRWPHANPQYDVGHLDRIDAIESLCPAGLYLCGSAYRGVGIPDCVHQGQEAATQALTRLTALMNMERVEAGLLEIRD